jgi:hypothetical protein
MNLGHSPSLGLATPHAIMEVAFYGYVRVPKGPLPDRYLDVPPDLIVEVLSPSDRWPKVLAKVA